jgi:hypothetical protein
VALSSRTKLLESVPDPPQGLEPPAQGGEIEAALALGLRQSASIEVEADAGQRATRDRLEVVAGAGEEIAIRRHAGATCRPKEVPAGPVEQSVQLGQAILPGGETIPVGQQACNVLLDRFGLGLPGVDQFQRFV